MKKDTTYISPEIRLTQLELAEGCLFVKLSYEEQTDPWESIDGGTFSFDDGEDE